MIDPALAPVEAAPVRAPAWGAATARPYGQFVGRRRLLRHLPTVLSGDRHAGLLLYGIGGIGKTTLAAEVLRRCVDHDPTWQVATLFGAINVDGLLGEVALAARRTLLLRDLASGARMTAAALAGRVDLAWQERFALLREHLLDDVPIVVVLDNFEDNLTPVTMPGARSADGP